MGKQEREIGAVSEVTINRISPQSDPTVCLKALESTINRFYLKLTGGSRCFHKRYTKRPEAEVRAECPGKASCWNETLFPAPVV